MAMAKYGTAVKYDGRNGEVWRRYSVYGWTQERIAEHFSLSQQRVSEIVRDVALQLKPLLAAEMVTQSMEFLRDVQARAMEIADLAGAPVAVGKDGSILYEPCADHGPGEGCSCTRKVVRDYSGRLNALKTAAMIDQQIRKLHGLDAPEKREMTGSVRYEVVGVDDADLT